MRNPLQSLCSRPLPLLCCTLLALAAGVSSADAAPDTHAAGPRRAEIVFLGTAGGPLLRLDRSRPATLFQVDGHDYLVDCGIGTIRRMMEAGIESGRVRTIFLTHLHADHDLGLADVMANDYLHEDPAGASGPIAIYGPPQTRELVDAAFHYIVVGFRPFAAQNPAAYHLVNGELADPFIAHEFDRDGMIFRDDSIQVTAAENSHYAGVPMQRGYEMKSYSYRVRTPYGVIVFTGDTGPSDNVSRLAKGADVLVAESSSRDREDRDRFIEAIAAREHWSPRRIEAFRTHFELQHLDTEAVGRLASKAGVKSVVLYHYAPNDKSDQAAYVRGVKKFFAGPVFAPDDLDRYCMSSGTIQSCSKH